MKFRYLAPLVLPVCLLMGCAAPKVVKPPPQKVMKVAKQAPAPDIVKLALSPGRKLVAAGQPSSLLARVRIDVGAAPRSQRPAVNIALALDTSSSMRGSMDQARAAVKELVNVLEDGDRISIVSFGSEAKLLVPSTELSASERPRILKRIEEMKPQGSTAMAAGLQLALQNLNQHRTGETLNRLVLISDGVPNDPAPLVQLAQQAQGYNATVTALGLGLDYDESVMAQIAQHSGGRFQFVEEPEQVAQLMRDEVLRLEQVVARNARLTLAVGPGVVIEEVVGLPAQKVDRRSWSVTLGDLTESKPRDVIVRLRVPARHDGSTVELLDARLDYVDSVVGAGAQKQLGFLEVEANADLKLVVESADEEVQRTVARVEVAAKIIAATAAARSGQLPKAMALLDSAEKLARAGLKRGNDESLTNALTQVFTLRKTLPSLAATAAATVLVPPDRPTPGGGGRRPASPAPPPMAPAQAASVRQAHDSAMRTLQGS